MRDVKLSSDQFGGRGRIGGVLRSSFRQWEIKPAVASGDAREEEHEVISGGNLISFRVCALATYVSASSHCSLSGLLITSQCPLG